MGIEALRFSGIIRSLATVEVLQHGSGEGSSVSSGAVTVKGCNSGVQGSSGRDVQLGIFSIRLEQYSYLQDCVKWASWTAYQWAQ